jgi:L-lysine exporter family protein LysE/ArgO
MLKCLGFTYLNPHVYSDTVFFLGNFSKNFLYIDKIYFGLGATLASFLFFFILGYLSKFLSQYLKSQLTWKFINFFIIIFMSSLSIYVIREILAY